MAPTLSRPGSINGAVSTYAEQNALFLKVFSGEVLTAFERNCLFKDLCQTRSISSGKSAQFPVTGRLPWGYHTPGDEITGLGQLAQNEVTINIDDYLYAAASLYSLDEAKNHYDIRSIHSTEIGNALSRAYDKRVARLLTLAARTSSSDLTANLPSGLTPDQQARTGTRIDLASASPTADAYVAAVFAAAARLDEKDVSSEGRVIVTTPEVYYTLIQSSRAVNTDWNHLSNNGGYAEGQISKLAGFSIYSSNHIAQGNVTAPAGERGYTFGGTTTTLSSVDMRNTKMLAFTKEAVGVVKLRDITMQMTGNDYEVMYQSTMMVGKYSCGFGVLRPECAIEVYSSV
jgi:hypothetical protein